MNTGQLMIRTTAVLLLVLCAFSAPSTFAADLRQAKTEGWIGEKLDGYLGFVRPGAPKDVQKLVTSINQQRKAEYEKIAKNRGVPAADVARLAAGKVIKSAASGHYVQNNKGEWVRVP